MEGIKGVNVKKINYEEENSKKITLLLIMRIFMLISIEFGIISLFIGFINPQFVLLFDIFTLISIINAISIGLFALLVNPPCNTCGQRTKYIYKNRQFFCKKCGKYFPLGSSDREK